MFFLGQDSDASTTTSLCGSRPSYTQKAEGRCDRRSSQSAHQRCINGYAFLDFLKLWKPEYSDISFVELSVAWNGISPCGGMGEEWRPVWISHWQNQLTCCSCICFLSFPCFLSQHASPDLPVMDVCSAAVSFDIFPPLAVDHTNSKTTANMGLLNGFSFCFVLSLSSSPPPSLSCLPPSLYFSVSIFIVPLQVFKRSCVRRSLRWTKMHQG